MARLSLCLLGAPRIERDGLLLDITIRKAVALLAYLAVTGVPHTRDTLAALFWPEADQERARGALRYTLAQLKAALGDGWLDTTRSQIHLPAQPGLTVDVAQITAAAIRVQAHGHPLRQPCVQCAPHAQTIVELQHGALLAGFSLPDSPAFDDWLLFEVERLRQIHADALVGLLALFQEAGDPAAALPYAQRLVAIDPLQEEANQLLIQLQIQRGDTGAAARQYAAFAKLLRDEFGAEPAAATTRLLENVRLPGRQEVPPTREPQRRSGPGLPPYPPLIGRAHELDAIGSLLDDPACRLLTLLGPGGSGKTSLALAVAHTRARRSAHGAAFVPLAGLSVPGALVATIAAAVGSPREAGGYTQARLLDELSERQLLLILDNLEHLLERAGEPADAVASLLDAILAAAPGVQILLTSRVRARLHQEQLYPVGGLDYPEWDDAPGSEHYAAVQLFVQRARRVQSSFALAPATAPSVVRIVRLLAGQPLAIELAAAWVATLSPGEIAAELAGGIDLLASEARNIPARHRSMRACYALSWEQLQPAEQAAQQAFSVFRGGFTREAAARVAGASARTLQALIDQSLLQSAPASDGIMRYGLHELLRQFAAEQLARDPQADAQAHERHAAYYLALVEQATAERSMNELWGVLDREHHNLIGALTWMRDHDQIEQSVQLAARLVRFWRARGYLVEGLAIMEDLVARAAAKPASLQVQAQVYYSAALVADTRGNLARAQEWLLESMERYRALDDRLGVVRVLNILGGVAFNRDDLAGAIERWQEMLRHTQEPPDSVALASERVFVLGNLGEAYYYRGALDEAEQHYEAALTLARTLERSDLEAIQLGNLGALAGHRGRYTQAKLLHGQALRIWQSIREYRQITIEIERLGKTLVGHGRFQDGARFLGAAARQRKELGLRAAQPEQREHEHMLQFGRERMGETAWTEAFEAGATLSTEAILDEALAMTRPGKQE